MIGNDEERYAFTKKGWIGTVVRADESRIDVRGPKVIEDGEMTFSNLEPEYFDLYTGDPEKAEETTDKPKEGKTLERGELVKTFMKLTETDKPLKELTGGMPMIVPAFMIILSQIENELLGEE